MQTEGGIRVRTYGDAGPLVLVLHGGPAGIGDARGMALGLADAFRVLEPWQRGSGSHDRRPTPVLRKHPVRAATMP